mmetsp:Transcript_19445/g.43159  ORF Transcript_19445/g.43159 Transcript_19445/m.43159 type:complete len:458 (+) Transcript_19445:88-1461(+)
MAEGVPGQHAPRTVNPPPPTTGHKVDLDALMGVRAIASLQVAVGHYYLFVGQGFDLQGGSAVTLFFIVSGFIMTVAYLPKCDTPNFDRTFLVRRAARIFPLYWLGLVMHLPVVLSAMDSIIDDYVGSRVIVAVGMILDVFLLQSWLPGVGLFWNGVSWTMSVQLFFYSIFGCVARSVKRRIGRGCMKTSGVIWTLYGVTLALTLLTLAAGGDDGYWLARAQPLLRLPTFLMGVYAGAATVARANEAPNPAETRRWAQVTDALSLLIFLVLALAAWVSSLCKECMFVRVVPEFLGSVAFAFWVRGLAEAPGSLSGRLLRWGVLRELGELSFAVYVLQVPVWALLSAAARGSLAEAMGIVAFYYPEGSAEFTLLQPLLMFPFMAILLLVSALACRSVEQPCRRWAANRTRGQQQRPPEGCCLEEGAAVDITVGKEEEGKKGEGRSNGTTGAAPAVAAMS